MKVSLNAVWDETQAFLRAERGVVVPLALGTLYLSAVLLIAIAVMGLPGGQLLGLIASVWGLVGQLALIDLVLSPRRSVREALGTGLRRTPFAILLYTLFAIVVTLVSIPIVKTLVDGGFTVEQVTRLLGNFASARALLATLPPWASLYMSAVTLVAMYLFVRLLLWKASLVVQGRPIVALKDSWQRTRGRFWGLFALVLLAGLVIQLVTGALEIALGAVFLLIGRATGAMTLGQVAPALIVALVAVAFRAVITVFLALYFRRTQA